MARRWTPPLCPRLWTCWSICCWVNTCVQNNVHYYKHICNLYKTEEKEIFCKWQLNLDQVKTMWFFNGTSKFHTHKCFHAVQQNPNTTATWFPIEWLNGESKQMKIFGSSKTNLLKLCDMKAKQELNPVLPSSWLAVLHCIDMWNSKNDTDAQKYTTNRAQSAYVQ